MPTQLLTMPHPTVQVAPEVQIDLDNDVIPIERPSGLNERQLGLLALDVSMIHPNHLPIVRLGRDIETDQGRRGFEPNTVKFVWPEMPEAGLSLHGILIVAINHDAWRHGLQAWRYRVY